MLHFHIAHVGRQFLLTAMLFLERLNDSIVKFVGNAWVMQTVVAICG